MLPVSSCQYTKRCSHHHRNFPKNNYLLKPIFDPISHRPPTHLPREHLPHPRPDPVDIFSLPEITDYPPSNPAPVLIEPFTGPFAELDKDIEEEIQSFRAEADKANEQALKKQIEALKNIISDQKNRE